MRRVAMVILLLLVPALAVGPGIVGATGASLRAGRAYTPVLEHPAKTCPKKGRTKTKSCTSSTKRKPTAKPSKKKPKPKATPRPRTATPRPTRTPVPTPTVTLTPTVTPTATATATPSPSVAQIVIKGQVPHGYLVAFLACGVPAGVDASFSPNPVASSADSLSPTSASASSTLTLAASWQVEPGSYGIEIWGEYQDAKGIVAGGAMSPSAVDLTITADRQASVKAVDAVPASGFQNCTLVPSSFHPSPVPTVDPSQVKFSTSISDTTPSAGESVTASVQIGAAGQPVYNLPVHFAWFGPRAIPPCDVTTDVKGAASCSRVNENPLHGQTVLVQVTFQYNGRMFTGYTSYMM